MTPRSPLPRASFHIRRDDLHGAQVIALLQQHLDEMIRHTPPDLVHAMPVERLRQDDVTFFSAWHDGQLAAVGALKAIGHARGELKSMRAADSFRGRGAGEAILLHLMDEARSRNYRWLGLETGRPAPFLAAQRLYEKHGFAQCEGFGDYLPGDFSMCMARDLG